MRPHRLSLLIWGGIAGYVILTLLVATGVMDDLDREVLGYFDRHRQPTLAEDIRLLTGVLSPAADAACLGIGAGALAWYRRRPAVFVAAATVGWAMALIVLSTKIGLGRSAPRTGLHEHGGAYPSGHTAAFLVCFGMLALLATTRNRRWRAPLMTVVGAATALVATGLVYDGFHWLTDTLGSISLGVALLAAFHHLSRQRVSPSSAARTPPNGRTAHPR